MATYRIEFANGDAPINVDGYDSVGPTLHAKYGFAPELGHPGDIPDGGDTTLFWQDAADAENDDGARALGSVRRADEYWRTEP